MVDALRKAKEQKEAEGYKKFLPIDYDAPLPAPPEDANWTDSIGARVRASTKFMLY
jgi:hypothetical protein